MANPEACPLSRLLRASHTVTGQDQCMVHAHGVCALSLLEHLFFRQLGRNQAPDTAIASGNKICSLVLDSNRPIWFIMHGDAM